MPKILGKFSPYDDANKLLDGRYLDGAITGSDISASGAITAGSLIITGDQQIAGSMKFGDDISDIHQMTGSLFLSGSLRIEGQTILDSMDNSIASLIVKGKTEYITQTINIQSQEQKPEITIEGLGTISHKDLVGVIDLGEGFTQ
jgi:hypothetical protein